MLIVVVVIMYLMSIVYIWFQFVLICTVSAVFLRPILPPHTCSPTDIAYLLTTLHSLKMILVRVLKH